MTRHVRLYETQHQTKYELCFVLAVLDNILCSGVSRLGLSDHSLVYVYRNSTLYFRNDISTQLWHDIKELYDPNDMWKKWKDLFLSVCDKHAPVKIKRTRPTKSPWIITILKKRMNFRDRLKNKAIKTKDTSIWTYPSFLAENFCQHYRHKRFAMLQLQP